MKKYLIAAILIFGAAGVAHAAPLSQPCYVDPSSPNTCIGVSAATPLPVTNSGGGGGLDVNITAVGGNAVTTTVPVTANQGTPNAGGATNSWPVQGAGVAGTPAGGVVSIQGVASGTAIAVTPAAITPTHAQTSVLASNLIPKASAGNLFDFNVSADSTLSGAAWWVLIFDATTLPADGTVTPAKCYALSPGATSISADFSAPTAFTTGIVIGVSTTGCFTKTASVHAFIGAGYQ